MANFPTGYPLPGPEDPSYPGGKGLPGHLPPGAPPPPLDSATQDAYQFLLQLLQQWGLESLGSAVLKLLQDGYTQEQVSFLIQDTSEYKTRFAGNELRKANGLAVLSPREYLAVEASYRQILASNGMPVGFYDQHSDFVDWIGKDVAPTEIANRVELAVDAANRLDAGTLQAFHDWFNLTTNDLAAFFLDQDRALPHINRIAKAVKVAGAGYREGLSYDQARAEQLGTLAGGRDIDQLIGDVAAATRSGDRLSHIYSGFGDYTQSDAESEIFQSSEEAARKRRGLEGMERANFSGTSGVSRGTLSKARSY